MVMYKIQIQIQEQEEEQERKLKMKPTLLRTSHSRRTGSHLVAVLRQEGGPVLGVGGEANGCAWGAESGSGCSRVHTPWQYLTQFKQALLGYQIFQKPSYDQDVTQFRHQGKARMSHNSDTKAMSGCHVVHTSSQCQDIKYFRHQVKASLSHNSDTNSSSGCHINQTLRQCQELRWFRHQVIVRTYRKGQGSHLFLPTGTKRLVLQAPVRGSLW